MSLRKIHALITYVAVITTFVAIAGAISGYLYSNFHGEFDDVNFLAFGFVVCSITLSLFRTADHAKS